VLKIVITIKEQNSEVKTNKYSGRGNMYLEHIMHRNAWLGCESIYNSF
jgi:hypothetical protein